MLIAIALIATLAVNVASAGELEWRRGGPRHFKPTADSQPIAKAAKPTPRRDGAVHAVAFEGDVEGPIFGTQQAGGTSVGDNSMRSVVVDRSDAAADERDAIRSAQLQFRPRSDADNRYNQQITEPFGQQPVGQQPVKTESTEVESDESIPLPPEGRTEPDLTPPPSDNTEVNVPDTNTTSRQPATQQRQPRTFQPAPSSNKPRQDPFVESDDEPSAGLPPVNDRALSDEGAKAQTDCSEEFAKLRAHTLDKVDLNIAITGKVGEDYPYECSINDGTWHTGRCWNETTYMWKASALCHKPLYFEDEALERYGHSWGPYLDPLVSGAHFFCTLPVLPYCMATTPPTECVYALGQYRPGNCAPYLISPVPVTSTGEISEGAAIVGTAFLIP